MRRIVGTAIILVIVSIAWGENEEMLFHYIKNSEIDSIKQLLVTEPSLINSVDEQSGNTLLMAAVESGQFELVRFFIDAGADVNAKDILSETSLMFAVERGDEKMVRLLLEKGADPNVHTRLDLTPLIQAAALGSTKIVDLLLSHGADIEAKNLKGKTSPLAKAASRGHADVVKLLLEQGADMDFKENGIWTPLMLASMNGHYETVKLLLDHGAEVDVRTPLGETALFYAIGNGHSDVARLLIEHGADVNVQDKFEKTALMQACARGDTQVVRLLLDRGADFKFKTKKGVSAYTLAKKFGENGVIGLLVKAGVDTTTVKKKTGGKGPGKGEGELALIIPKDAKYTQPPKPKGGLKAIQDELKYPKKALKKGIEGQVIVDVYVSARGRVSRTKIKKSIGDRDCDKAAISAVKEVKWEPALNKKKKVKGWVGVPVVFKLDKKQPKGQKDKKGKDKDK